MKMWYKDQDPLKNYRVEFNGKFEDDICIEAKASHDGVDGYVVREWWDGPTKYRRKFYGTVFIVRVTP